MESAGFSAGAAGKKKRETEECLDQAVVLPRDASLLPSAIFALH